MKPKRPTPGRAIRPNLGIEAEYRRRMVRLVDEMARSVRYWLSAAYRANEPAVMALDATPAKELQKSVDELVRQWRARFRDGADDLARYFALASSKRSDAALREILRKAGWSVKFTMTPAMRDVLAATVEQNVALITSIPEQYLTQVQGSVMRSVQAGRDLSILVKDLQEQHGVARRRAEFIARDQNNKATSALSRARQIEIGLDEAVWLHSGGGKEPRPTHVANSGKRYKIAEGWYDPAVKRHIWPGQEPNCRCVSKPVVPGLS